MRLHDVPTLRLGLACLLAFAACGGRTKEPPPAKQAPAGAPAPSDTRTNPQPSAQPAHSGTPGPASGVANPTNVATPDPGHEPPGGAPGAADPDKSAPAGEPAPSKGHAD